MVEPPQLAAALDTIPALAGPRHIEPLPGGSTNHAYRVATTYGRYVARFSPAASELLPIDRDAEYQNSVRAAIAGVGPGVVDYQSGSGVLVVDWVDGRTLEPTDLTDDAVLDRVITACRRLHAGPRFVGDLDIFAVQRSYLAVVRHRGIRLPARYLGFTSLAAEIEAACAARPQLTVPCQNDLVAGNLIDDGTRVVIIDYEYAANNDPYFDLGNMWCEAGLPAERLSEIVAGYYGAADRSLIARARLYGLIANYTWTLWEALHDRQVAATERFERAVAEFATPDLPGLLAAVRGVG